MNIIRFVDKKGSIGDRKGGVAKEGVWHLQRPPLAVADLLDR
jgi:hypothetical protein